MEECCRELLADLGGGRRFEINYSGYLELANRTGLNTFRVLAELYARLMALRQMRVKTSRACWRKVPGTPSSLAAGSG